MEAPISSAAIAKARAHASDGYMDGNDLLRDLRGENGAVMRAVAVGYVMALHDAAPVAAGRVTLEETVSTVEDWLEMHAARRHDAAAALVREALGHAAAPGRTLLRVARRRAAEFGTVALCMAAGLGGWALNGISSAGPDRYEISRSAANIARLVLEERRYEKDLFINIEDRDRIEAYARKWNQAREGLSNTLASAERLELSLQDRAALQAIATDFDAYAEGYERVLRMIRRGEIRTPQEANDEFARYKGAAHRIEASCQAIYERAVGRQSPST